MSWNSTVTCSWCYNTGHNKNGCKERKEYLARNPDSWEVQRDVERKGRKRQCSYCKDTGHTKRTCNYIKSDKAKTIQMNKEWRADALDYFKNLGLGVGALVQFVHKRSYDTDQVENVLVSEIFWDALTFAVKNGASPYAFRCRPLEDGSRTRLVDFPVDPAGIVTPRNDFGLHIRVLGPVSGGSIEANVPDSWLTGDCKAVDDMFVDHKGKQRERYYIDWIEQ